MISCVIHTFNSEEYLEQVLTSVAFCDEVIIVDMYSTDKTMEIAAKYGARVIMHENIGFADPARQYGLDNCTHDWILAVDSDEIIPVKLAYELKKICSENLSDLVYVSRRNYMFGKEILGGGWGYRDDVIPRFFKKRSLSYGSQVHNFIKINPKVRSLKIVEKQLSIIHFNYDSVSQYIKKLDTYTTLETIKDQKFLSNNIEIIYHFFREFFGRFIILKGYKDGWLGVYLALSMAFYRATVVAKRNLPNRDSVVIKYKELY